MTIRPVRYALLAGLAGAALFVPATSASAAPQVVDLSCITTAPPTSTPA